MEEEYKGKRKGEAEVGGVEKGGLGFDSATIDQR